MSSPSRRAVLGALASVPVTGCLEMAGPTTQTTPTDRPGGTATPTDDDVAPTATPTPSGPVRRQPGEAYQTNELSVTVSDRYAGFAPDAPESVQPLGFAVPTDAGISEAAVVWNGPREVRWPLPDDLVAKLASAPEFSLDGFRVPETAREGVAIDVELDVANTGDRDGHFLAELGNGAISDQPEIGVAVPAGETVTASRPVEARFFDGAMDVVCRWEGGVRRRPVEPA